MKLLLRIVRTEKSWKLTLAVTLYMKRCSLSMKNSPYGKEAKYFRLIIVPLLQIFKSMWRMLCTCIMSIMSATPMQTCRRWHSKEILENKLIWGFAHKCKSTYSFLHFLFPFLLWHANPPFSVLCFMICFLARKELLHYPWCRRRCQQKC